MTINKKSEKKMIKLTAIPAKIVGEKIIFDKSVGFDPITLIEYLCGQYFDYALAFKSNKKDMAAVKKIAKKIYGKHLQSIIDAYDKQMISEIYFKCYGG